MDVPVTFIMEDIQPAKTAGYSVTVSSVLKREHTFAPSVTTLGANHSIVSEVLPVGFIMAPPRILYVCHNIYSGASSRSFVRMAVAMPSFYPTTNTPTKTTANNK